MAPPTTITTPPRDFGPNGAPTTYFWDPDIIAVDPSFNGLAQPNTAIKRLWTGALWAEGPAWNAQGRYLVWSDIPNNRQMRWLEDDGRVSVFRTPSNNSNGNTFDFQGRQLSCEHLTRRVVRYELDGSVTVLADSFRRQAAELAQRRRAASGRQLLVHRSALWRAALRGRRPTSRAARAMPAASSIHASASRPASCRAGANCRPIAIASIPTGRVDLVVTEEQVPDPNGLCFSPDYKKLYVASHRQGAGRHRPGRQGRDLRVRRRHRQQALQPQAVHRLHGRRRQVRARRPALRRQRQLWGSSNAGRAVGYSGVTVWIAGRQADRPHPPARGLRQRLLRRPQAQPPVHGGEPVALRRLHGHAGRGAGLSGFSCHSGIAVAIPGSRFASPGMTAGKIDSLNFVTNWQLSTNCSGKSWAR